MNGVVNWILRGAALAYMIWYAVCCIRAELPKKGTLEWIGMYDRPAMKFSGGGKALRWQDSLWWLLPAVPAALAALAGFLRQPWNGISAGDLLLCAMDVLAAGGLYLLLRLVTGNRAAALLGGAMAALQIKGFLTLAAAPVAGMLIFLWLWASAEEESRLGWLWLMLAALLAGGAIWFQFSLVGLLLPFGLTVILAGCNRKQLWWEILLELLAAFAAAVAAVFAAVTLQGLLVLPPEEMDANVVLDTVLLRFLRIGRNPLGLSLSIMARNLPTTVLGLGCLPVLWCFHSRRDASALFVLLWSLALYLIYPVLGAYLHPVAAGLLLGYLTARLFQRKHKAAAIVGVAVPLAATLCLTLFTVLQN